ncbi:MAG: class I SAM-dependent methyltransferase [Deltaproteobacteria bacterium]|nr:class I SAM-dependent methyltransferase [Deltaproteobacteria bacterium]
MIGSELALDPNASILEMIYIRLAGVPINGLRIRLRRILPKLTEGPGKVLDAGCGRGVFVYQVAKKFPDASVMGVDVDDEQLEVNRLIAERAGLRNVTFEHADVSQLPFKEDFDLVLSVDNLEHIQDDMSALKHLAESLKVGGRLVLHVPGYERRWFFFTFRNNFDVPGHFRPGYRLDELTDKVRGVDLHITEAFYTFGWLETISNNISYLITAAEGKNRLLYALVFPFLNMVGWFGKNSRPKKGAGILIIAEKRAD